MSSTMAEPCLIPKLVQQVRHHEADTLAGTRGRGEQGMQVAVEGEQLAAMPAQQD
jgi:hypothetical protein